MEPNENQNSSDTNPIILRVVKGLFGKPYLPVRLVVFLVLVILTDYAYFLLREPATYWFDYRRDTNLLGAFRFGPFAALGIYLVYIAILWAVLRILNRRIAIALWGGFTLLHISTFILYPPSCSYATQLVFPAWLCRIDGEWVAFIIGIILGLALAWGVFEKQKPAELTPKGSFISRMGLSWRTIVFFALWLVILGVGVGFASHIPTKGWKPILAKHAPSPRYEAMVAYDTQNNKAILFGGTIEAGEGNWTQVNDTWEWDGTDWTHLSPLQSPPARHRGAMAYDPKRNIVLLFGGWNNLEKSLSDTWEWNGKNWEKVGNCDICYTPPSRGCQNMFYDTVREEIIMYGGCNENQEYFNDAWGWNGEKWENIYVQDSPIASGAPIIYDPKNQQAIGFLAWMPTGTWVWDKNGWSKLVLTVEPPLRGNAMMANDPETGNSLMFGGSKVGNNLTTYYDDTWVINGTTWSEVNSGLRPPGRWGHVLFFDTKLKKFILFGGFGGKNALNDLWGISPSPDK
jgi:hypothetical protein